MDCSPLVLIRYKSSDASLGNLVGQAHCGYHVLPRREGREKEGMYGRSSEIRIGRGSWGNVIFGDMGGRVIADDWPRYLSRTTTLH